MKTCPAGDGALRGLTRLPANFRRLFPEIRWQSRLSPVSADRFFAPVGMGLRPAKFHQKTSAPSFGGAAPPVRAGRPRPAAGPTVSASCRAPAGRRGRPTRTRGSPTKPVFRPCPSERSSDASFLRALTARRTRESCSIQLRPWIFSALTSASRLCVEQHAELPMRPGNAHLRQLLPQYLAPLLLAELPQSLPQLGPAVGQNRNRQQRRIPCPRGADPQRPHRYPGRHLHRRKQ